MNNLLRSLNKQKSLTKKNQESLFKYLQTKTSSKKELHRAFLYIIIKDLIKQRLLNPREKTFSDTIKLAIDESYQKQDKSLVRFLTDQFKKTKNSSLLR